MDEKKVALVTGASRQEGLGFEVSRQLARHGLTVLLTARDLTAAAANAARLQSEGLDVRPLALDINSDESVVAVAAEVERTFGRLDVLVNNAGGGFDPTDRASLVTPAQVRDTLAVNLEGPWRLSNALLPLLRKSAAARVVNVSSQAASFGDPWGPSGQTGNLSAYIVSKAALNAMTRKLALDLKAETILVNAACPGWIATYPGTAEMGARPVRDGAASVVWAATLPDDGPTGGFYRDGQQLPW